MYLPTRRAIYSQLQKDVIILSVDGKKTSDLFDPFYSDVFENERKNKTQCVSS